MVLDREFPYLAICSDKEPVYLCPLWIMEDQWLVSTERLCWSFLTCIEENGFGRCQMFSYNSLIFKKPRSQLGWTSFPSIDLMIRWEFFLTSKVQTVSVARRVCIRESLTHLSPSKSTGLFTYNSTINVKKQNRDIYVRIQKPMSVVTVQSCCGKNTSRDVITALRFPSLPSLRTTLDPKFAIMDMLDISRLIPWENLSGAGF